MAQRTSAGADVLLGLLTIAPMSGYDLGQAIRDSIGFFWNESYGQIYPNLKKLAAAGLVTCREDRQKGKPNRQVYSITKKGRERLQSWLAVAPQAEVPRNELLLKLFFGAQTSPQTISAYVTRMAERERALLERFERIEHDQIAPQGHLPDAPYWRMAARFGQLELEAHLRWAEETLAKLNRLGGPNRARNAEHSKGADHEGKRNRG